MSKKDKQIEKDKKYIAFLESQYLAALRKLTAIEKILNPQPPKL